MLGFHFITFQEKNEIVRKEAKRQGSFNGFLN